MGGTIWCVSWLYLKGGRGELEWRLKSMANVRMRWCNLAQAQLASPRFACLLSVDVQQAEAEGGAQRPQLPTTARRAAAAPEEHQQPTLEEGEEVPDTGEECRVEGVCEACGPAQVRHLLSAPARPDRPPPHVQHDHVHLEVSRQAPAQDAHAVLPWILQHAPTQEHTCRERLHKKESAFERLCCQGACSDLAALRPRCVRDVEGVAVCVALGRKRHLEDK